MCLMRIGNQRRSENAFDPGPIRYHSRNPSSGITRMMITQISFSTGWAPDCRIPTSAQMTSSTVMRPIRS